MNRFIALTSGIILLLAFACSAPPFIDDERTFQDELDFAIDLARYSYWDLAEDRLRNLESFHLSADQELSMNMARFTALHLRAWHCREKEQKKDLYQEALIRFKKLEPALTDQIGHIIFRIDAAEVCQVYGRVLLGDTERGRPPLRGTGSIKEAGDAFREGMRLLEVVMETLEPVMDELEQIDFIKTPIEISLFRRAMYLKGTILYYLALTSDDEQIRQERCLKCIETFDDYIWEASEDDFYSLWAYLYQAMAYSVLDDLPEALDLAGEVIHSEFGINLDQAKELPPEYARLITDLAEAAYRLIAEFHREAGDHEKADATLEEMKRQFRSRNLQWSEEGDLYE